MAVHTPGTGADALLQFMARQQIPPAQGSDAKGAAAPHVREFGQPKSSGNSAPKEALVIPNSDVGE